MDKVDRLLNEFVEAWNAGERPDVDDYVERAPEAERDELAGLIGAFLEIASTPRYSPEQLTALRHDPTVRAIARLAEDEEPTPLPRLRERAKLRRDEVVEALASKLGYEDKLTKIRRYYHQLEIGTITPGQVSQRVIDALADILRVTPNDVEQAGSFFHLSPEPAAGLAFLRRDEYGNEIDDVDRLEMAAGRAPVPEEDWDEVDRLFLGGR